MYNATGRLGTEGEEQQGMQADRQLWPQPQPGAEVTVPAHPPSPPCHLMLNYKVRSFSPHHVN